MPGVGSRWFLTAENMAHILDRMEIYISKKERMMPMVKLTVKNIYANGKQKSNDKLKKLLIHYIKNKTA